MTQAIQGDGRRGVALDEDARFTDIPRYDRRESHRARRVFPGKARGQGDRKPACLPPRIASSNDSLNVGHRSLQVRAIRSGGTTRLSTQRTISIPAPALRQPYYRAKLVSLMRQKSH